MYKLLIFITLFSNLASLDEAILVLSGASCVEELSENEIERYYNYSDNALPLNFASKSQLVSSGLFTNYQVISLLEYRRRSGDILSCEELALLNGFTEKEAEALSYFVSFSGSLSSAENNQYHHKLTLNYKNQTLRTKYNAQIGNKIDLLWSTKNNFKSKFEPGTISSAYYGRGIVNKVILGHFNSNFGQGLCSWTAFQLSGYSSVSAFMKKPSGFVPTGSITAQNWGICSEVSLRSFDISLGYSINTKEFISNISYNSKTFSLGLTALLDRASFDWKIGRPDLSFYGELSSSYKGELAALSGLYYSPRYGVKYAFQARYFDAKYKQYSGLALGMERSWIIATADFGYRLDKSIFQIKPLLVLKNKYADIRWAMRYRNTEKMRNDLRLDLKYSLGPWSAVLRINGLYCNSLAFLTYLQIGRKTEKTGVYTRLTYYNINSWEDRIYVYQQEAPGGFNVPAFYGRGYSAYIYALWNITKAHTLYLRCEYRKDFEFQIQYRWKL